MSDDLQRQDADARPTLSPPQQPDSDDLFSFLALPDPFVSGQAPRPTPHYMPAAPDGGVIDLTDSPPRGNDPTVPREIIDLDALPDIEARPYVPLRRLTPSTETERARLRQEAYRGLAGTANPDASWSQNQPDSQQSSRLRRRQWLLETAERRTVQRQQQEREVQNSASSFMSPHGILAHGLNQLGVQYRAFVHGPNGGGPVNGSALPHHFLSGGNIALLPRMGQFRRPELDYAMFNQVFPPYQEPVAPTTVKYVPPEPCKEPFTRSYTESDLLICPGCRSELGGVGDESKRRIYVSKCSHVYCGDCGSEIKGAAKKQGILCRAPGCGKKITKTKIFEAYI